MTAVPRRPSPSLRALVAGLVDYAGLFPPASLGMREAVRHYAKYLRTPEAWMLGRFVVPVGRIEELAATALSHRLPGAAPWRLSALLGEDLAHDIARLETFNREHAGHFMVDVVELRAESPERIRALAVARLEGAVAYVELPQADDPRRLLETVAGAGLRAKIRTGGVTAASVPTVAQVARFLVRCAEVRVPFKATAGLHHPLRGEYRLTYEQGGPSATMFGFLNVFVAAALARQGVGEDELVDLLEERDPTAIRFLAQGVRWRQREISAEALAATRASFAVAFGSCSFREPVDDLHDLELL